jgi:hypothetical protein
MVIKLNCFDRADPADLVPVMAALEVGDVLESVPDWTRVHLSSVAVESFARTLDLLHPDGVLTLQDLFVRKIDQYASFRGPGKLEGSVVNWLNGPLFRQVARERGFDVELEPFTYREGSNIVVLTAARQTAARPVAVRDEHELAAA